MNIKSTLKALRNMDCEIAEVMATKDNITLSYIVYLVSEPSNYDLVIHCFHDYIFNTVEEFESLFNDNDGYDFTIREFPSHFNSDKIDPDKDYIDPDKDDEENTIRWYKIKCSLFKQELGIKLWKDMIDFMTRTIGFDNTITGQTSNPYEGVEVYYENGQIHKL